MTQIRLGERLVQSHVLTQPQLSLALAEQKRSGGKLGEILVRLKLVPERTITEVLAEQLNVPAVDLDGVAQIPPEVLSRVPAELAHAWKVLPLEVLEGGRVLVLASADVLKPARLEELRTVSRSWIVLKLAGRSALTDALIRCYGPPRPAPAEPPARFPAPGTPKELRALISLLVEKGFISEDELNARLRD